MIIERPI